MSGKHSKESICTVTSTLRRIVGPGRAGHGPTPADEGPWRIAPLGTEESPDELDDVPQRDVGVAVRNPRADWPGLDTRFPLRSAPRWWWCPARWAARRRRRRWRLRRRRRLRRRHFLRWAAQRAGPSGGRGRIWWPGLRRL